MQFRSTHHSHRYIATLPITQSQYQVEKYQNYLDNNDEDLDCQSKTIIGKLTHTSLKSNQLIFTSLSSALNCNLKNIPNEILREKPIINVILPIWSPLITVDLVQINIHLARVLQPTQYWRI